MSSQIVRAIADPGGHSSLSVYTRWAFPAQTQVEKARGSENMRESADLNEVDKNRSGLEQICVFSAVYWWQYLARCYFNLNGARFRLQRWRIGDLYCFSYGRLCILNQSSIRRLEKKPLRWMSAACRWQLRRCSVPYEHGSSAKLSRES